MDWPLLLVIMLSALPALWVALLWVFTYTMVTKGEAPSMGGPAHQLSPSERVWAGVRFLLYTTALALYLYSVVQFVRGTSDSWSLYRAAAPILTFGAFWLWLSVQASAYRMLPEHDHVRPASLT